MKTNKKIYLVSLFSFLLIGVFYSTKFTMMPSPDLISEQSGSEQPSLYSQSTTQTDEPAVKSNSQPSGSDENEQNREDSIVQVDSKAPRQEEIRRKVIKEYPYRTMATPNDPLFNTGWSLQKIQAPAAWDISTGTNIPVVAVIDSGFALQHEDLSSRWHTNSGETGGTTSGDYCWTGASVSKQSNNCDDDQNGYVDDFRGWNFYSVTNDPQAGQTNPTGIGVSHGTSVAGLVGAAGNNSKGSAGVNWNASIMPLQALNDNGIGYTSDIVAAMYYAVDNGASVINLSLGGDSFDQSVKDAVIYAYEHDVVVVAAAGNCGTGNESGCENVIPGSMAYPAIEQHVISVGATTQIDQRASFSSYGSTLDIIAPGSGTLFAPRWSQTNQTSSYTTSISGTSFAAPQVTGLVSLIQSIRPHTSVEDITALLLATTSKPSTMNSLLYSEQFGHGIINAAQAMTVAQSLNQTDSTTPKLQQAGGSQSEHSFLTSEHLGSGCELTAQTYCTIRLEGDNPSFSRYLPYKLSNSSGQTGWSWNSNILTAGQWRLRAISGESISTKSYVFWQK